MKLFNSQYFIKDLEVSTTSAKIKAFISLPKGWYQGEGEGPSINAIETALKLNKFAEDNFLLTDAVPGVGGEIQLIVYGLSAPRDHYMEVTANSDKLLTVTRYDKVGNKWTISRDEEINSTQNAEAIIWNFGKEINKWSITSASSERNGLLRISEGLPAQPSKTTKAEYRLFRNDVFATPLEIFVST